MFPIGSATKLLDNAPGGGARFSVHAQLAGREFVRFHVDVGFGDSLPLLTDELTGEDYLDFAMIPPAAVRAISTAQQFAEKIHAYTLPWSDRVNTRSRDLIDLVLLIESGSLEPGAVCRALGETFGRRNTHALPESLGDPPERWATEVAAMAREVGIEPKDLAAAAHVLRNFFANLNRAR